MALAERLRANGDINAWGDEIARAVKEDQHAKEVRVVFGRGENRLKVLPIRLPALLLQGANREFGIRYLTASVDNAVVCEGASVALMKLLDIESGDLQHIAKAWERGGGARRLSRDVIFS